jgi:ADP-ribose pyrophosphatase YjhB (NUDIX family)
MKKLIYCSNCGKRNSFGRKDGNIRYYCLVCETIHYQNPKPTATLICSKGDEILLVKRAFDPGKGEWSLPGGFLELGETLEEGAERELKEETNLNGKVIKLIGNCSYFNSIFGDILLLGLEVKVEDWKNLVAGDDALDAKLFKINQCPKLVFECHQKIFDLYIGNKR